MRLYSAKELEALTGVNPETTYRWDRREGLAIPCAVQPEGTGTRRMYTQDNVVAIAVAVNVRAMGMPRSVMVKVLGYLMDDGLTKLDRYPLLFIAGDKLFAAERSGKIKLPADAHCVVKIDLAAAVAAMRAKIRAHDEQKAKAKKNRESREAVTA